MTDHVSPRRAHTREKLLQAAVVVFAEKGVPAATVEEICEEAGFTRGAFYSNFDTKDELCVAVLQRQCDDNLRGTQEATAVARWNPEDSSVDALIERAVAAFIRSQPTDSTWVVADIELRLHALRNPIVRAAFNAVKEQVGTAIAAEISTALDRAGARLTVPLDQALDVLHGVYEHSALTALLEGRRSPDAARAEQLAAVLRSLVVVSPGA